ncbi:hypothetical protein ACE1CI_25600 [Aerosakkonemataceae cyanobacterium BLCC-F50]|uniref:Uncharacterized protein n=1 Tax=Floridaenema flaviceps BLCC-F50 TaxID=3153642 RepID=A0ABV4XXQ3_9CYAN
MSNLIRFTTSLSIFATLFMAIPGFTQSQSTPLAIPRTSPNESFKVTRTSGTCPQSIGIWTATRQYEGGGEFTVIANTSAIASPARLVRSNKKSAEFSAPLKSNFASCVGTATSQSETLNLYSFRLQNGNVTFRVQLPKDTSSNPSEITVKKVISGQPGVRWAIAD